MATETTDQVMVPAGMCEIVVADHGDGNYVLKIDDPSIQVFDRYAKNRGLRVVDLITHTLLTARSEYMKDMYNL